MKGWEEHVYYLVIGGGGAYMSATYKIPKIKLDEFDEYTFVCYPRRGASLTSHSKLYDCRFGLRRGWLGTPPDEALAYMGERLSFPPKWDGD